MLLFNTHTILKPLKQVRYCPHCSNNTYHLANKSQILYFTIIPIAPFKIRYSFECYQCGNTEPATFLQLPLLERWCFAKYFMGLIVALLFVLYFYQQQQITQQQKYDYLASPKLFDTYLVLADKFNHQPSQLNNLKVAQIIEFDEQFITFKLSNYSYKRNHDITIAMRTSLLVQQGYFSQQHITLPRGEVMKLYHQGVIYDVLRPKAYSLKGGFVMYPPKPKPLYKGLKLDNNNQQGIMNYKAGLFGEALTSFTLAAESGSQWGQLNLAQMYRDGQGTQQDLQRAEYWFRQSTKQGNTKAKAELEQLCLQHNFC